jgi:methionyl-tRNA synthetase
MGSNFPLPWEFYPLLLWSIMWAGFALWRAARSNQRNWFIAFLFIHTLGILELIYLFYFAKKKLTSAEVRGWFGSLFSVKAK